MEGRRPPECRAEAPSADSTNQERVLSERRRLIEDRHGARRPGEPGSPLCIEDHWPLDRFGGRLEDMLSASGIDVWKEISDEMNNWESEALPRPGVIGAIAKRILKVLMQRSADRRCRPRFWLCLAETLVVFQHGFDKSEYPVIDAPRMQQEHFPRFLREVCKIQQEPQRNEYQREAELRFPPQPQVELRAFWHLDMYLTMMIIAVQTWLEDSEVSLPTWKRRCYRKAELFSS